MSSHRTQNGQRTLFAIRHIHGGQRFGIRRPIPVVMGGSSAYQDKATSFSRHILLWPLHGGTGYSPVKHARQ